MSQSQVFKSSLTSRRFPALRTLTAEDVEVMVMPAPSPQQTKRETGDGSTLFDPNLVKPSAVGSLSGAAPKKKKPAALTARPMKERPPFRPCNPMGARDSITERRHGYVSMHSPYDLAHKLQVLERAEAAKFIIGGTFCPSSGSKAKKAIEVNYFLNSPDAETIEAERRFIQDKARKNMLEYYRRQHANLKQQRSAHEHS